MGNIVSSISVAVIESNPVTASVKSAYHLWNGETSEAKQTFMRGLEFIDKIPLAGHVKAGIHKLAKDDEGAAKAFKSANRSTLVVGTAAAAVATGGGALLAVGCAVGAGQAYNLATGDSKFVEIAQAITDTNRVGWDKFDNIVLQAVGLAAEVAGDVVGARARISALPKPPILTQVAKALGGQAVLNNSNSHLAPKPTEGPKGGNPWGAA